MIHKRVNASNMRAFTDELKELLKKHGFAACAGIVISNNSASSFEQISDQMILGTDHQRVKMAKKIIESVATGFTGSPIIR